MLERATSIILHNPFQKKIDLWVLIRKSLQEMLSSEKSKGKCVHWAFDSFFININGLSATWVFLSLIKTQTTKGRLEMRRGFSLYLHTFLYFLACTCISFTVSTDLKKKNQLQHRNLVLVERCPLPTAPTFSRPGVN